MVANSLHKAYEEYCACPHYHTLFDNDESSYAIRFNTLLESPQLMAGLPQAWQRTLLLIVLAQYLCTENPCPATNVFLALKYASKEAYFTKACLAPINLANLRD